MNTENLPDLGFDWAEALTMVQTTGVDFGINLVTAIVIFFLGKWVVNLVVKGLTKAMQKGELDVTLSRFIGNLARMLLMLFVVIAAINQLGVQTASLIALLGAAGLAVGLALQGTLANFASGVMLLVFRPFDVGHFVDVGGTAGTVTEIGIFATTLRSPDNIKITVPNSQIYGATISNYNGHDTRRVDLVMGISYDDNIQTALDTIEKIVTADERVLADPALQIAVSNLGGSSVDIVVRPWCNAADYWNLRFDLTRRLKEGLEAAGCSIPYPQRDVHMYQVAV